MKEDQYEILSNEKDASLKKWRNSENGETAKKQDEDYLIFSGKLKIENEGGIKKYICNICGFQVLNLEDFKKHLEIHGENDENKES
jgi:hypothetical protein